MDRVNPNNLPLSIRTDEFRRQTASRIILSFLGWVLIACLVMSFWRLVTHKWPDIWAWVSFFVTTLVIKAGYAYREIIALLERQNALLERLLARDGRDG